MKVSGIWLRRMGEDVQVLAEIDGEWKLVITEAHDGMFSHIVEEAGMAKAPPDEWSTKAKSVRS